MIRRALHALAAAALSMILFTQPAAAQSTVFTYQGELKNAGAAANGPHDLRFHLFDAPGGGNELGSVQCLDNVPVANGLFTVQVDFGQQFASSSPRYLEIEVRQDGGGGLNCGNAAGFTTLSPRQLITSTPRAMVADVAHTLGNPNGSSLNVVNVDNSGRVGVGLTTQEASLDILSNQGGLTPGEGVRIRGTSDAGGSNLSYLSFARPNGAAIGYVGDGSTGDDNIFVGAYTGAVVLATAGGRVLNATAAGRVGIGTPAPSDTLDVRGNVRLGSAGEFFAVKSASNDRIIRGYVNANGTIGATQSSGGFTVVNNATGVYTVTFSTPFAAPPTVVIGATAQCCKPRLNGNASTTSFFVHVNSVDAAFTLTNSPFTFIAIGP